MGTSFSKKKTKVQQEPIKIPSFVCDCCYKECFITSKFHSCLDCQALDFCVDCFDEGRHLIDKEYCYENNHLKTHKIFTLDGTRDSYIEYMDKRIQNHNPRHNMSWTNKYYELNRTNDSKYYTMAPEYSVCEMQKPVIYVYHPTPNQKIKVELINHQPNNNQFECLYPLPKDFNNPSWDLLNLQSGYFQVDGNQRVMTSLYWESKSTSPLNTNSLTIKHNPKTKLVKKEQYIDFLEQSLDSLGLDRGTETIQMIQYWLPHLLKNNQSLILFDSTHLDQIDLKVSPHPDIKERIFIWIHKIDDNLDSYTPWVPSNPEENEKIYQTLMEKRKDKYVVIEWGGSIIQ